MPLKSDDNVRPDNSHIRQWCNNEEETWDKIRLSMNM